MKSHLRLIIGILVLLLALPALSGCFGGNQPTPDLTLTALFAPTQGNLTFPPTWTPQGTPGTPAPTSEVTATKGPTGTTGATATSTLTSTAAPLPSRPGPLAYAYFQSVSPTIDGNWGEWVDNTVNYPIQSLVFGASNWSGNDDLEGSYILGWNNSYLFVGVKVHDDVYVQNETGDGIYLGDSIELLIDTDLYGDFYNDDLSADDYQIGISPGNPTVGTNPEAFKWYPTAGGISSVPIGAYYADGVYRMEFAIPWSKLGVTPWSGEALGFAISISDNDNPSANEQQTMMSNDPLRHLTEPGTWGTMVLR
jgi:hypothetical protein